MFFGLEEAKTAPSNASLPLLVVFGLDHTLWPFWIDVEIFTPLSRNSSGVVTDAKGRVLKYFKEVPLIFKTLVNHGIKIGVTSLTTQKNRAKHLLRLLELHKYISYCSIDRRYKDEQFEEIHERSGINYTNMLFFDDGLGAINDVSPLGVESIQIKQGMDMKLLDYGLRIFKNKHKKIFINKKKKRRRRRRH